MTTYARQTRLPRADPRARRNADRLRFAGQLGYGLGLNALGQMSILLAANPGLEFTTGALKVKVVAPITLGAAGIGLAGTMAQFDTACTDGNFAYAGGAYHDGFSDFVANEHVDHAAVSVTGTDGCAGGGYLTSSRTITLAATIDLGHSI